MPANDFELTVPNLHLNNVFRSDIELSMLTESTFPEVCSFYFRYDLIPLRRTSEKFQNVERTFRQTLLAEEYDILEIFRVQNLKLLKKYIG